MKPLTSHAHFAPTCGYRVVVAWILAAVAPAHAARPLLTDDARVIDTGNCQVESWSVRQPMSREYWALPACSGGRGVEWALGIQRDAGDRPSDPKFNGVAQYKRILRDSAPGSVGSAFAVGSVLSQGRALPYFYIPVSWMSRSEESLVHLNVGAASSTNRPLNGRTWGLALEQQLTESTWLIAERYSPVAKQWQAQGGIRWWVVPAQLQLDTTYGQQHTETAKLRFISIGVRWIFPSPL